MLIVNKGTWLEFCDSCGESEILTNAETGESISVRALFDRCSKDNGSLPDPAIATPQQEPPDCISKNHLRLMCGDDLAKEENVEPTPYKI